MNGQFHVCAYGGREDTGRDALDWIAWCTEHGAGEVCLNRIDTISNAMELRGFGKKNKRTWYTQRPFVRCDLIALGVGVLLLLLSLTVTIRFGRFYNPFV